MKTYLHLFAVTLGLASIVSSTAQALNCKQLTDGGYAFAVWAYADPNTDSGKKMDADLRNKCQQVDCPIFCTTEKSKVPKAILRLQQNCRTGDKAACKKFYAEIGLKAEPDAKQRCFYLGGKACDMCATYGGKFCSPDLRFGGPISDGSSALTHKIACVTGYPEACASPANTVKNLPVENAPQCEPQGDGFECVQIVKPIIQAGKLKEALAKAMTLCKKYTIETCQAFYRPSPRYEISEQYNKFNTEYLNALESECKANKTAHVCYALADINRSKDPVMAQSIFRSICLSSPKQMTDLYWGACYNLLRESVSNKSWAEADIAKDNICRFFTQNPDPKTEHCAEATRTVQMARGATDLLSANAACKTDGSKTYYDKNGRVTMTLSCKSGILQGTSEFVSQWVDPDNWFREAAKVNYLNGVANGSAIVGQPSRNLTEFQHKDGRVNGHFNRFQNKVAGASYPFIDGTLTDGILTGEIKTGDNETRFFENGYLKWLIDRRGQKEDITSECPSYLSSHGIESKIETYIKDITCNWSSPRQVVIDPQKGAIKAARIVHTDKKYEILTFNNGFVTESRECDQTGSLTRIRIYGRRIDDHDKIDYGELPYLKILDVHYSKGKLHGEARYFQEGYFNESAIYDAGNLQNDTRKYGLDGKTCPGLRKKQ